MTPCMSAISASEPDRRLDVPDTGDELARLASTLNSMLDRLQEDKLRGLEELVDSWEAAAATGIA